MSILTVSWHNRQTVGGHGTADDYVGVLSQNISHTIHSIVNMYNGEYLDIKLFYRQLTLYILNGMYLNISSPVLSIKRLFTVQNWSNFSGKEIILHYRNYEPGTKIHR